MRLLFAAAILASIVSGPALAQSCETISVRNAAGQVTSSTEICADENGKWVDPAVVIQGAAPVWNTGEVFTKNSRETLQIPVKPTEAPLYEPKALEVLPAAPVTVATEQPTYSTAPPLYDPAPPVYTAEPASVPAYVPTIAYAPPTTLILPAAPVVQIDSTLAPVESVEIQPVITERSRATVLPAPSAARWQSTSGQSQRQELYAKLGLVCVARQAMFCGRGECTGLCTGNSGWCDGKTGETYPSLEAIERVYCRKIKRR